MDKLGEAFIDEFEKQAIWPWVARIGAALFRNKAVTGLLKNIGVNMAGDMAAKVLSSGKKEPSNEGSLNIDTGAPSPTGQDSGGSTPMTA